MAAEAEAVGEGGAQAHFSGAFGDVVEIAVFARVLEVQGLVHHTTTQGESADRRLQGTGATEQMACHGLGARHGQAVSMGTEDVPNGQGLVAVVQDRAGSVSEPLK